MVAVPLEYFEGKIVVDFMVLQTISKNFNI